jgi:hypothetical protein
MKQKCFWILFKYPCCISSTLSPKLWETSSCDMFVAATANSTGDNPATARQRPTARQTTTLVSSAGIATCAKRQRAPSSKKKTPPSRESYVMHLLGAKCVDQLRLTRVRYPAMETIALCSYEICMHQKLSPIELPCDETIPGEGSLSTSELRSWLLHIRMLHNDLEWGQ